MNAVLAKLLCQALGQRPSTKFSRRERRRRDVAPQARSRASEYQSSPFPFFRVNIILLKIEDRFPSKSKSSDHVCIQCLLNIFRGDI